MKTSQIGIDLIKHFEGLHDGDLKQIGLQPKKCPAGIWTEGYGIAMRDSKGNFLKGNTMPKGTISTEEEAVKQLADHLGIYEGIVMRKIKVPLKQNEFDALVSHTYNTGGSDTLFKLINQNAPKEQIEKWFTTKYITANGKRFQGLVNRRNAEAKLYFYGE
jgi:lysozyme